MKRKLLLRALLGFPLGLAIGYVITILLSLFSGGGHYLPCVPTLAAALGSELHAVLLQALLCGLLGAGFAACSLIWEVERWSLIGQTALYFFLLSLLMIPIAYFAHWMEHSFLGFLSYFGIFVLVFLFFWLLMFFINRRNVKRLNEGLNKTVQTKGSSETDTEGL